MHPFLALSLSLLASTSTATTADDGEAPAGDAALDLESAAHVKEDRLEVGVVPAIGYDSNLGLGVGALGALAKFSPGFDPYRWRAEILTFLTIRENDGGDFEVPFHAHYFKFDWVEAFPGVRLFGRVGFFKQSNSGYFGLGGTAPRVEFSDDELEADPRLIQFNEYDHIYPQLIASARIRLLTFAQPVRPGRLDLLVGTNLLYNDFEIYQGSLLEDHAARAANPQNSSDEVLADLLKGIDAHWLWMLTLGLLLDTRDNEFHPIRGGFHELSFRISPGVDDDLAYVSVYAMTSWFQSLVGSYLVLAGRVLTDLTFGDAPLYELARFGTYKARNGPGGSHSLRGVLLQRFHGKAKVIGNFELRSEFWSFSLAKQRITLGALAFVDTGRVWADYRPRTFDGRSLDGAFWEEFQVGLGGGGRIRWGDTFVIRLDYGASPTDGTTGFYVSIEHVF